MSSSASHPPHLHRHAIESILGFLSIDELIVAAQVAREWSAASLSMAPVRSSMTVRHVADFFSSRLRWAHVSTLRIRPPFVSCDALRLLVQRAPHLTDLQCALSAPSSADAITLPRKLVRLAIAFILKASRQPPAFPRIPVPDESLDEAKWTHYRDVHLRPADSSSSSVPDICCCHISWTQRVLAAASQLPLESLEITLLASELPKLNVSCLVELTHLRDLTILFARSASRAPLSDHQVDALRSMHWLRSVHIEAISAQSLRLLLRSPHNLQWTDLDTDNADIDAATGECIATLPLTSLCCSYEGTSSWLPRLAGTLRELSLRGNGVGQAHAEELCAQLCGLVRLTRLSLASTPLDSTHMAPILQSMTALRHLGLQLGMYRLESLAFLAAPGVPQLESLSLDDLDSGALAADSGQLLHVVRSQSQLRELRIMRVWNLTPLELFIFQTPSQLMPRLAEFWYEPALDPDEEDDDDDNDDGEDDNDWEHDDDEEP